MKRILRQELFIFSCILLNLLVQAFEVEVTQFFFWFNDKLHEDWILEKHDSVYFVTCLQKCRNDSDCLGLALGPLNNESEGYERPCHTLSTINETDCLENDECYQEGYQVYHLTKPFSDTTTTDIPSTTSTFASTTSTLSFTLPFSTTTSEIATTTTEKPTTTTTEKTTTTSESPISTTAENLETTSTTTEKPTTTSVAEPTTTTQVTTSEVPATTTTEAQTTTEKLQTTTEELAATTTTTKEPTTTTRELTTTTEKPTTSTQKLTTSTEKLTTSTEKLTTTTEKLTTSTEKLTTTTSTAPPTTAVLQTTTTTLSTTTVSDEDKCSGLNACAPEEVPAECQVEASTKVCGEPKDQNIISGLKAMSALFSDATLDVECKNALQNPIFTMETTKKAYKPFQGTYACEPHEVITGVEICFQIELKYVAIVCNEMKPGYKVDSELTTSQNSKNDAKHANCKDGSALMSIRLKGNGDEIITVIECAKIVKE